MRESVKSFGGVAALQHVDFALEPGEIHGLVGENGAGKSTLMKIIAGVHHDYDGTMELDGTPVRFRSAREALAAGIGMVHQELSVVPELSVAENVYLGVQPARFGVIDWARMRQGAREHLSALGIDLDARARMGNLPVGLQQLGEIARVCSPARASSSWTNPPPRSHRPKPSAFSPLSAGCARKAGAWSSSRTFSMMCWRSATE